MSLRSAFIVIVLLLGALACNGDLPLKDLDQSIEKALTDWNMAGLAIGIVKDGHVVHLKGYGYSDINKKTPVNENTIFGIGSTSKTFGAAVIGVLVHEGNLTWDDKVIHHLPDFRLADPYVTQELTVRDLLCHRSGVGPNNIIFFGSVTRDAIVHKARFLRQAASLRSRFDYHNIMFLTAGQVAARVTDCPWDDTVRERIFQPLGMGRTCTSINDLGNYANVAKPHRMKDGKLVTIPWLNVDNSGPAGCINSCAADMVKWIQVHLKEGRYEGKEIWNVDVQREMHSPHTIMSDQISSKLAKHANFGLYGLGWMMHDYRGEKIVHHGGATDGMGSFVGLVPDENLGVVVLQNTIQSPLLSSLAYRIIDAYLGAPRLEWMGLEAMKTPARSRPDPPKVPLGTPRSLPLEGYTGVYNHPIYEHVEVELRQGNLVLDFDLYPSATLEHMNRDTFKIRFEREISSMWNQVFGHELEITFRIDVNANVSELSISLFGDFTRVRDMRPLEAQ